MANIEIFARPTLLFRYRSLKCDTRDGAIEADPDALDQELSALEEDFIYCSSYTQMNDAMEGMYRSSSMVRKRTDYDDTIDLIRNEKLGLGIASFSETWNNELMWAHYADQFRGICVAYSVPKLLEGLAHNIAFAKVSYVDKPFFLNLAALKSQQDRSRAILSTKNLKWSYEREWRLFAPQIGRAPYEAEAISCVYLGPRMPEADRKKVKARLRKKNMSVRQLLVDGYSVEKIRPAPKRG